jgi:hypothetical protein
MKKTDAAAVNDALCTIARAKNSKRRSSKQAG